MSQEFTFDFIHLNDGCKCLKCSEKYYPYPDPFFRIFDISLERKITFELCEKCLSKFSNAKCDVCKYNFEEMYEEIFVNFEKNTKFCKRCFNALKCN